eukprot:4519099-Lingulodinium_polyedra.AAC.1
MEGFTVGPDTERAFARPEAARAPRASPASNLCCRSGGLVQRCASAAPYSLPMHSPCTGMRKLHGAPCALRVPASLAAS